MVNRLNEATSPYLLQHKDNPVRWQPWDERALAAAREADRPILLSIGYSACHWCHVMAHESFENDQIAALMNAHFVNIKVDREERPDLDQIYQHALALLGQQGGWPLTMFLTPAGEPFWGGTYFPPESRYGRPGFPQVLESVSRIWRDERDKVSANTEALRDALQDLATPTPGTDLPSEFGPGAARQIAQAFDTIHGGLAGAPKFPQAPLLAFLWRTALSSHDPTLRHAVLHTLRRMCQGGIYDHLGGGFARYSVDAYWLVPHFEKMLYDNALLLHLLADAWADTREPLFAARARETIGWLQREMLVDGAFASSLDADSEGEEGRYYVWTAAEIDQHLGRAADAFRLTYGVTDRGNWEGKCILNRLHQPGLSDEETERQLRASADLLLEVRERRVRPARDDKVLADWNGLAIAAIARVASVFREPAWHELALTAFRAVCRNMSDGRHLAHSTRGDRRLDLAFLDDYAAMADAALMLYSRRGDPALLELVHAWLDVLDQEFWDDAAGGYHQVSATAQHLLVRPKSAADGPAPAGNGLMLRVLGRLHAITGDQTHLQRAEMLTRAFAGEARRNPLTHGTLLGAASDLARLVQVVVVGAPPDPAAQELLETALGAPSAPIAVIPPISARELSPLHPAAGKSLVAGRAAAYVCHNQTCRPPVTSAKDLLNDLGDITPG